MNHWSGKQIKEKILPKEKVKKEMTDRWRALKL